VTDAEFETAIDGADGEYSASLSPHYVTPEAGGPFGGYLAALLLRTAGRQSTLTRPASFHCVFLNAASIERVDLEVTTLRSSSRAEALRVSMTQGGKPIADALVWLVGSPEGLDHGPVGVPSPPHPDSLRSFGELYRDFEAVGFAACLDVRPEFTFALDGWRPSGAPPWSMEELRANIPPQAPVAAGWVRLRGQVTFSDPFTDAGRAMVALDSFPIMAAQMPHLGTAAVFLPSLDFTVRFHEFAPNSEWLYCQAESPIASEGVLLTGGKVWSQDGKLVATGAQHTFQRVMASPPARG
jgi:acyl-CoA thioesterase-2